MKDVITKLIDQVGDYLPNVLLAIAILVGGWILALVVSGLKRRGLNRVLSSKQISGALDTEAAKTLQVGTWAGRVIFYVLMAVVLAFSLRALQLSALTGPLDSMLQQFTAYIPQLIGAVVLLAVAWGIGSLLRLVVSKALSQTKLDKRVMESAGIEVERPLSQTLGDVAFWLPLLLFLPAVMGVLELQGLLAPLQTMFDDLFGMLPNILGAGLILVIGWFIAKIVRQIVTALLTAVGLDKIGERAGMGTDAGPRRLSAVVGLLAYTLVIIPTTIAALDALQVESISRPATTMLSQLMNAIPLVFGAAVVLGVAFLVGKIISGLVTNVLTGVGFDKLFEKLGLEVAVEGGERRTPSQIVGYLTLVAIVLMAAIESASLLGFGSLATLATQFFEFGAHLILGMVIFGVGLYLGNLAYHSIPRGGRWGVLYCSAARIAIIGLATAMALEQTGVAQEIVRLAFTLILGAIAVAAAIAFGLGARDAAARTVDRWTTDRSTS